jgi:hypothetical protein
MQWVNVVGKGDRGRCIVSGGLQGADERVPVAGMAAVHQDEEIRIPDVEAVRCAAEEGKLDQAVEVCLAQLRRAHCRPLGIFARGFDIIEHNDIATIEGTDGGRPNQCKDTRVRQRAVDELDIRLDKFDRQFLVFLDDG